MIAVGIKGVQYQLGVEIGRGGEGTVYAIAGQPELLAKVYHKKPSQEKYQKLIALVQFQSEDIKRIAAWPIDIIFEPSTHNPVGFVMNRIVGKDIHLLYGNKTRVKEFPFADWRFLVWTSLNLSRAFAAIHSHKNIIIGDVNHANILVNNKAEVSFIDCDSFQISNSINCFRCEGGVPEFTPPELQGILLRNVTRNANHDCFGLATMIFLLLFTSNHPFAGIYKGKHLLTLEEKIKRSFFAYGKNASQYEVEQPTIAPRLDIASSSVADLFERAFSPQAAIQSIRPSAIDWVHGLEGLSNSLKQCTSFQSHIYFQGLSSCPWCKIENKLISFRFFPVTSGFNFEQVWTSITQITFPQLPSTTLTKKVKPMKSKLYNRWIKFQTTTLFCVLALMIISAIVKCFLTPDFILWCFYLGYIVTVLCYHAITAPFKKAREEATEDYNHNKALFDKEKGKWKETIGFAEYIKLTKLLTDARDAFRNPDAYRDELIKKLNEKAFDRQRYCFLTDHSIKRGNILGIGPGKCATLASRGVNTAADISRRSILVVPGFGEGLCDKLMIWREYIERIFRFDPKAAITPAELHQVDQQVAQWVNQQERTLLKGKERLEEIVKLAPEAHNKYLKKMGKLQRDVEQAQVNLAEFSFLSKYIS